MWLPGQLWGGGSGSCELWSVSGSPRGAEVPFLTFRTAVSLSRLFVAQSDVIGVGDGAWGGRRCWLHPGVGDVGMCPSL